MVESKRVQYLFFSAPVNSETAHSFLKACKDAVNNGVSELHIAFATTGGTIRVGLEIYNMLRALPCELIMYNVGMVRSMGLAIFCAAEKRYASLNSSFIFHDPTWTFFANSDLRVKDLTRMVDSLKADKESMLRILEERTNISREELSQLTDLAESTKFPDYALQVGLIHEIRDFQVPKGCLLVEVQT